MSGRVGERRAGPVAGLAGLLAGSRAATGASWDGLLARRPVGPDMG